MGGPTARSPPRQRTGRGSRRACRGLGGKRMDGPLRDRGAGRAGRPGCHAELGDRGPANDPSGRLVRPRRGGGRAGGRAGPSRTAGGAPAEGSARHCLRGYRGGKDLVPRRARLLRDARRGDGAPPRPPRGPRPGGGRPPLRRGAWGAGRRGRGPSTGPRRRGDLGQRRACRGAPGRRGETPEPRRRRGLLGIPSRTALRRVRAPRPGDRRHDPRPLRPPHRPRSTGGRPPRDASARACPLPGRARPGRPSEPRLPLARRGAPVEDRARAGARRASRAARRGPRARAAPGGGTLAPRPPAVRRPRSRGGVVRRHPPALPRLPRLRGARRRRGGSEAPPRPPGRGPGALAEAGRRAPHRRPQVRFFPAARHPVPRAPRRGAAGRRGRDRPRRRRLPRPLGGS